MRPAKGFTHGAVPTLPNPQEEPRMGNCQVVTGGAGFIGSNYVRHILTVTADRVVIIDKLTYAGNLVTIRDLLEDSRVVFEKADISDPARIREIFRHHQPCSVVNFAAESHVDRSIDGPRNFFQSNTAGVFELLECARMFLSELAPEARRRFRFLQVSTDEVFGTLGPSGAFTEKTPYAPRSPYSATKASADHLVRAYGETYGIPVLITNCSNNYGPFQFPEKLVPLVTLNALAGRDLPVYGRGNNVRDWLHVQDHCSAILQVLKKGEVGTTYAIGARNELTNLEVVYGICAALQTVLPEDQNPNLVEVGVSSYEKLITFVPDRPGHDFRYAIDPSRIESQLGWKAKKSFEAGLLETIAWYIENQSWCREVQAGVYGGERLGLGIISNPEVDEVEK